MKDIIEAMQRIAGEWPVGLKADGPVIETDDEDPILTIAGPKKNATAAAKDVVLILNSLKTIIAALMVDEAPEELKAFVSVHDVKELIAKEVAKLGREPHVGEAPELFESKGELIKLIREEIGMTMGKHLEDGHQKY